MRSINDFLKEVQTEFPDELAGKSSAGGFDGPPLPVTRQYRVTVVRGEWRQAQSGNYSFAFTFEVVEPDEFAGRKFTEYYSIEAGANKIAKEKFSKFIGESGVDLNDVDRSDNQAFADAFVGVTFVVATRVWGEEQDRTGLRYLNRDRGQALQVNIAPPKAQTTRVPLKADISVLKQQANGQADDPGEPDITPPTLPGSGVRPSNLPPGLRRNP